MHRSQILETLATYNIAYPHEKETVQRFESFIKETPLCFERYELGHITGSSFVLSPDQSSVLLALHAKLNRWLQLGGHADGCSRVEDVAFREAFEESGIEELSFFTPHPIDLDIHEIPEHKGLKAHLHYDVRFLFIANQNSFVCSNESLELKWVPLDNFHLYCSEPSLLRAVEKIRQTIASTSWSFN